MAKVNIDFDLERAKAGEPIEAKLDGKWFPAHLIGLSIRALPTVQIYRDEEWSGAFQIEIKELRMKGETFIWWGRIYIDSNKEPWTVWVQDPGSRYLTRSGLPENSKWYGPAFSIEVEG